MLSVDLCLCSVSRGGLASRERKREVVVEERDKLSAIAFTILLTGRARPYNILELIACVRMKLLENPSKDQY